MSAAPPPVFVVGHERSGTTLLRLMLTSHPALHIPNECTFALMLRERFDRPGDLRPRLAEFAAALADDRQFERWKLTESDLLAAFETLPSPVDYRALVGAVYRLSMQRAKPAATVWGDKNPAYARMLPEVWDLFPDARVVLIVRDPRAVAASLRTIREKHDALWNGTRAGLVTQGLIWRSVARLERLRHSEPRLHALRYEDLVRDPTAELTRICIFLGLPFDSAMLAYHQTNRERKLVPDAPDGINGLTFQPPQADRADAWRETLPANEQRALGMLLARELRAWGYDPTIGGNALGGATRLARAIAWDEAGDLGGIAWRGIMRRVRRA